jgi:hypothetical protein
MINNCKKKRNKFNILEYLIVEFVKTRRSSAIAVSGNEQ